jgi:hypothetical protein|tara:strand:+ start:3419 stop:4768 length:1350 start_codon:yes stop_codon:yes gene_type:complete
LKKNYLHRRKFIKGLSATGGYAIAAPYVKTSHSAGRLLLGLWDHWIPGANDVLENIIVDWGEKNGVEVKVDFITSIGNKLLLTAQAESRAKTGHDIFSQPTWYCSMFRHRLEPLDDVVEDIINKHGPLLDSAKFYAHLDGHWRGSPAPTGSFFDSMVSRFDLFKEHAGIDLQTLFPGNENRDSSAVNNWNWDAFLLAAEKLYKVGKPFGATIGATADSRWLSALFTSYGAELVNKNGEITVDSDEVRQVLEYMSKLTEFMPKSIYAWDDSSNNRWIISGQGSAIFNPASAWAVAKRDNPDVANKLWHHDVPRGPKGRYRSDNSQYWGLWDFAENKSAAKDLLRYMAERPVIDACVKASQGYDIPLIISHFNQNKTWIEASPPDGVLYNYPMKGDEIPVAPGYPAPPEIASQITTQYIIANLTARVTAKGHSLKKAIRWAENELEGVMRG